MSKNLISGKTAEKAMKEAVSLAMDKYKKMGVDAVFSKNGKLYYMTPEGKELEVKE